MRFLALAFVVGLAAAATTPPYCPWTKTITAPGATKTATSVITSWSTSTETTTATETQTETQTETETETTTETTTATVTATASSQPNLYKPKYCAAGKPNYGIPVLPGMPAAPAESSSPQ